jgi:hypothetical protein
LKSLLKFLLKSVLNLIALVAVSLTLPIASFRLISNPTGAEVVSFVVPWTVAFWVVILRTFVGSRFWKGREAVLEWRARHGGYIRNSISGTGWMFGSLIASYCAEFVFLYFLPGAPRFLLPVVGYSPVALALWSAARG